MSTDVFSLCSDDDCLISLLLRLVPNLFGLSRFFALVVAMLRLLVTDFNFQSLFERLCSRFSSFVLVEGSSVFRFLHCEPLRVIELEFHGNETEMRQLQSQADYTVVRVLRKESGVLLLEHVMKMVQTHSSRPSNDRFYSLLPVLSLFFLLLGLTACITKCVWRNVCRNSAAQS